MEEKDFDPRVIAFADNYSLTIKNGISSEITEKELKWIKHILLIFLEQCITSVAPIMKNF